MNRAVFLDRDGVLVRATLDGAIPRPPASVDEVEILPGAVEACEKLKEAGFRLIMVTNQPDVARGKTTLNVVEAINDFVASMIDLDAVRVCYHDDADKCACRKPKPGMLLDAARDFDIELEASFMVGDRWRDIEAGQNAGCRTILVASYGDAEKPMTPDFRADSLTDAAQTILSTSRDWS
ncbi:MAG: D-glycero-alpha-D-manno-heptose-1,7-bisphosphate 7-phosphatase [Actinomycetota bacterium]